MKVRPLHDWLLLRIDPIQEREGSLFLVHGGRVRTATVLEVGPGKWIGGHRVRPGVERGERIAFFRENLEHQQGKQVARILQDIGEDLALIREPDVLFAFGGPVQVS